MDAPKEGHGYLLPVRKDKQRKHGPTAQGRAVINGRDIKIEASAARWSTESDYLKLTLIDEGSTEEQLTES